MRYRIDQLRYSKWAKVRVYTRHGKCGTCDKTFLNANTHFNTLLYTVRKVEMPDPRDRFGFPAFPLVDIFCSMKCANMYLLKVM